MGKFDKFAMGFDSAMSGCSGRNDLYHCSACHHIWRTRNAISGSYKCPRCNSKNVHESMHKGAVLFCSVCNVTLTKENYVGKCKKLFCENQLCKKHVCERCGREFCEKHMETHRCRGIQ